jgi:hypothetical protein
MRRGIPILKKGNIVLLDSINNLIYGPSSCPVPLRNFPVPCRGIKTASGTCHDRFYSLQTANIPGLKMWCRRITRSTLEIRDRFPVF